MRERTATFEQAVQLAAVSPRDRVTLLTDVPPSAPDDDRARRNGLEVVVVNEAETDRAAVEADRIALADDVILVGDPEPISHTRRFATTTMIVGARRCSSPGS